MICTPRVTRGEPGGFGDSRFHDLTTGGDLRTRLPDRLDEGGERFSACLLRYGAELHMWKVHG